MLDERPWRHDPWDDADDTHALQLERPRRSHRSLKWLTWALAMLVMLGVVAGGVVGLWYTQQVNPKGDPGDPVTFTVDANDTLQTVAQRLEDAGLVSKAWMFEWYVERNGGLELLPGYFRLRPDDHMGNLMRTLSIPPSETFTKVTFPEGFTYTKMGFRLEQKVPRLSSSAFGVAATDGSTRSRFQPAAVDSLEGMLFPDTYQVSNGETEAQLVQRMVALMERVADQEDIGPKSQQLGFSEYQIMVIASLIEREAGVEEDRARIARVIYNRLFLGMPLQIDASLYYQQDANRPFSELRRLDTPYNTYMYPGLPPTPIANPGRASIRAALNPAANPSIGDPICADIPKKEPCLYLYYVLADADGRHVFAATVEQHEENVRKAREAGLL
jgi:UPF0755 protein